MYPVSSDYIAKIKSNSKKQRKVYGTIGSVSFDKDDLLNNTFAYADIAVKSAEIKLGGVFIGNLSFTVLNGHLTAIQRGTWQGKIVRAYVSTLIGVENGVEIWEPVPLKPYKIVKANHSAVGIDIVAEDAMNDFDKPFPITQTSGTIYDLLAYSCDYCNVGLGMTKEECEALPNGTAILGLYMDNDIQTFRDFISWIAVTAGGFATINRDGNLVIRTWKAEADIEIGVDDRFEGGTWSDFATNFSAITVTNTVDGTQSYYATEPDDGMTLDIGENPLLQYGTEQVKTTQRRAVLNAIQNLKYIPFNSSSLLDPAFDLGDVILYSDGVADDALSCIMRIDFSFLDGATLKGYGKNPSEAGAKSSIEKQIAQQSKSTKDELVTHTYINTMEYDLGNHSNEPVINIEFATVKPCLVTTNMEILADFTVIDEYATVMAYYYLNDELQGYHPVKTVYHDGKDIIPLMYFLKDLSGGVAYEWRVELRMDGGTATIDRGDIHAWLQGQGLVAIDEFAGTIRVEDTIEPIVFTREIARIVDAVVSLDIAQFDVKIETLQDLWNIAGIGDKDLTPIYDRNVSVQFAYVVYALVDDAGDFCLVSDDGQFTILNSDGGYT